ncbi:hypothetical protein H5410_040043 [Solanum commersonii]|uniref:Uncharacterized protein n=1 Tax=Solanum commersonii TaxID=4109 RepID=A0A9J5XMR5_SOLCO|nr:hypothetical protein H5410_040043 [Solanum commersonii]
MTIKGVEAILDNCPHLVSLDLRLCKYVSLNKVLSNIISGRIKDLKHPHDSLPGQDVSPVTEMIPWHRILGQPVTEPDEAAKLFWCPLPPQKLKPGSCCHDKDERLLSYQAMGCGSDSRLYVAS